MWGVVLVLVGLVVVGAGAREVVVQRRLRRVGVAVPGRVVRHRVQPSKDGPVTFAMVEFVDAQAVRRTFQARSSGVKGLPVGADVPVRYLPGAPASARIDITRRLVGDVAFLMVFGAVFAGIGVWMLATGR